MSNVVAFRRKTKGRIAVREHSEAGRILLFTGVRYIRNEEEAAPAMAATPPATPKRRRTTIERLQA